ncbi:MAG TPA: efflux RND transporter periplasmic adaptor subunit [Longimicrobiaceae bacterium]|nr:efflux RND transporter periplasmic adaptor subunit [Longimicrobiaceae bacterium]
MNRHSRFPLLGLLLAGLTLAAAGCGGESEAAQGGGRGGPGEGAVGGRGGPGGPGGRGGPAAVETAPVTLGTIAREVTVSGTVEPIRTVAVNSQMAGALLDVNVEEGSPVREGQVLARIDAREIAAQVRSAQASYGVAQAALERAEQLRQRQVITAAEYERDQAARDAARAQLDGLRARQGYSTVRAPSSGVITVKSVESGDVVGAQTRLFEIADVSTMVVPVRVSELDVVKLSPGDRARVELDALPGRTLDGRIRRVFPSADPATRLVPVEVALQGEGARAARPGFLARVSLALGQNQGVKLVPQSAIVQSAGETSVFVVKDGKAERRPVETGLTSRGQVEVLSGLEAGETVVTVGNNNVRDGAEVRVVAGPGAGAAPRPGGAQAGRPQRGGGR